MYFKLLKGMKIVSTKLTRVEKVNFKAVNCDGNSVDCSILLRDVGGFKGGALSRSFTFEPLKNWLLSLHEVQIEELVRVKYLTVKLSKVVAEPKPLDESLFIGANNPSFSIVQRSTVD